MARRANVLAASLGVLLAGALAGCSKDGGGPDEPEYIPYCFVGATQVATPAGPVAIEDLAAGDVVLSWNLERARPEPARVRSVMRREATSVLAVRAGGAAIAGVTASHPFYDPARGAWVRAGDLDANSVLLHWPGGESAAAPRAVTSIARREIRGPVAVYDLEVEGHHNFFAEGVLVHNKQPVRNDFDGDGHTVREDGTVEGFDDCNDEDPAVHPGAPEVCGDGADQNCDRVLDDGCLFASRPPFEIDRERLGREGRAVLVAPSELDLGPADSIAWRAAIDLAGEARTVPVTIMRDPDDESLVPWPLLPEDAAQPALFGIIRKHYPDRASWQRNESRAVIVALRDGAAHLALDLPVYATTAEGCTRVESLELAPAEDGTVVLIAREQEKHMCAGDAADARPAEHRFQLVDGAFERVE